MKMKRLFVVVLLLLSTALTAGVLAQDGGDDDGMGGSDDEVIGDMGTSDDNPQGGVSGQNLGDNANRGFGIFDQQCSNAYVGENFLGLENEMTEQIEDDPTAFYGRTVTIEGYVDEMLETGFIVRDNEPFDFSPPDFVVVDATSADFGGFNVNLDDNVCVTGTIYPVDANEIQSQLNVTLEEGSFSDFDATSDDFAMVVENVSVLDEAGVIVASYIIDQNAVGDGDSVFGVYDEACSAAYAGEGFLGLEAEMTEIIEDNPTEFIGTTVTIEGYVDLVLPNSFILQDNEPFDFTPPDFVVLAPEATEFGGVTVSLDDNLCVTGTIYPIDAAEIQSGLTYTLDEGYFDQFDLQSDDFAMVAEHVSVLDTEGVIVNTYIYDGIE